jgi:hypothetical protein
MPVTGLDDDYWLHSLMANFGASAPYDPAEHPSLTPDAGVPGGGVLHYPAQTPGAPSLGYPAMGPSPGPPAASPGPAQGLSLTNNPVTNWLRNNVSIGAPNFANISPAAVRDFNVARAKIGGMFGGGGPAAPATSPPAGRRTDAAYGPYDDPNAPEPIGDYVSRVGNYYGWPTPPAPAQSPMSVATVPRGVKRTDAAYGPYDAPGAGAPQGSPSQTPRPAPKASSDRFVRIDRVNAGPLAQPGRGYQTALNLASLFGRS